MLSRLPLSTVPQKVPLPGEIVLLLDTLQNWNCQSRMAWSFGEAELLYHQLVKNQCWSCCMKDIPECVGWNSWMRIHIDYAGPVHNKMLLVVCDAHSKWIEVEPVSSPTSSQTIEKLRRMFATHGLPEVIVSDNGPQFTSYEFGQFLKKNGIRHITSPPYHPSSNGQAERTVQTLKRALQKSKLNLWTLSLHDFCFNIELLLIPLQEDLLLNS